jgi:hypothetical protein
MSADPRDRFRKAAEKKEDAQTKAGSLKSKFETFSIAELLALPPPEYLIEGILISGGYGGIYGPPGSLKSFICLSMALAVAYGERWCGREVKQHAVLYVAGEGVGGLGQRIRAWQKHFGQEGVPAPFRVLTKGVNLTDPVETAHLILAATEAAEAEGQAVGFIIIDTVARAMVGADENSAQDMGEFNEACAEMIRGIEGSPTVLAVHHSGKDTDRGSRGSTSFPGAVDSMLRVTRDEERLTLKVEKQKDGRDGFDVALKKLDVMEDGAKPDDTPLSLVVVDASDDPTPKKHRRAANLTPGAQLAFSALAGAVNQWGSYRKGLANVPGTVKSVTELEWRSAYYARSASPTQEAKAAAFKRAHEQLAAKRVVVLVDSFVWIVDG